SLSCTRGASPSTLRPLSLHDALPICITPTASAADLAGCDLIIEAVFESRALKAQVTREAEPQLAPGGFFASNTSTLPISGLAQADRKSTRLNSSHVKISYAVFCLKKK